LQPPDHGRGLAVWQTANLLDDSEKAVGAHGTIDPGHQDEPGVSRRLGGIHRGLSFRVKCDRGHHAGQDNLIGQGQDGQFKCFRHFVLLT
jgi:hypothetical protein